jgi:hypothetical protein
MKLRYSFGIEMGVLVSNAEVEKILLTITSSPIPLAAAILAGISNYSVTPAI